ncbi:phosphatidylinositol glycan anchor biosynthesis class O [Lycorma delicatula]|uniref:phosphatidylinositol glycan anchor biosynthesis class O n=1 Tax=Lycorma delicatula TaxID=130591 RepID=UPI003F50D9CE
MAVIWKYILFIIWVSYLLLSGLLLFTRGFLLNRDVLSLNSSCKSTSHYCEHLHEESRHIKGEMILDCTEEDVFSMKLNYGIDSLQHCTKNKVKVIVLLIDALHYDFVAYNNNRKSSHNLAYQNKMTVINDLLNKSSKHARLYKFIADPPTATMQRLNGLTTGSLPTFIDIGSNFATSEISEDNIIDQLVSLERRIVFMGDDTWTSLYPKRFIREFSYPSFNVWDLDTVDSGIKEHLVPEIKRKDWDVIIAHFLGVDHCGHRYGPLHHEMNRKLKEMDQVIRDVIEVMDKDTMLFVIGDHGMTMTGDHGGDSEAEVTSAMFVYSPGHVLVSEDSENGVDESQSGIVRQVDIVPTMATILGVPIPFSNIGTVITNVLPAGGNSSDIASNWKIVTSALWANIKQATLYIQEYSKNNKQFPVEKMSLLLNKYHKLRMEMEHLVGTDELFDFINDGREYLKSLKEMCEQVWVQFDSFSMSRGLVIVFLTLALTFLIVDGTPGDRFQNILDGSFLFFAYGAIFFSILLILILNYFEIITNIEISIYFATGACSVFVMAITVVHHWTSIAGKWYGLSSITDWLHFASRIIIFLSVIGVFSNSYIIEESSVISFLFLTLLWFSVFDTRPDRLKKQKLVENFTLKSVFSSSRGKVIMFSLLLSVIVRISSRYWRCREEQIRCLPNKRMLSNSSQCLLTVLCFAVFITACRICLRSLGNLVGFSPTVFISRYAPTIAVVSLGGYWILHSLPVETQGKLFVPWQLRLLPRTVILMTLGGILTLYVRPLSVYHLTDSAVIPTENIVPALFHQLKELMVRRTGGDVKGYPVVFGLATAYSATLLNMSVFLCLLAGLLLGQNSAASAVLMVLSLLLFSAVSAIIRQNRIILSTVQLFDVPWWSIVCWGLSAVHFFYSTSHQPVFSSLHWDAAFLTSAGSNLDSLLIPGLLVLSNTFCSQMVHALLLPMLLIAPFTLHAVAPKLAIDRDPAEVKRGELLIFERESVLVRALFSLAIRYILFQGLRVFMCMMAAAIHSRHLMVWKVFAPKLIFEGVAFTVSLPCILAGVILVHRVTVSVDRMLQLLEDHHR